MSASPSKPCAAASDGGSPWQLVCIECASNHAINLDRVVCDCGGALDLTRAPDATWPSQPATPAHRYAERLPCAASALATVSLVGDHMTPLVRARSGDAGDGDAAVWFKCDHLLPSGSFKDRGAVVLAAHALEHGAGHLVLDSSGNAGAAMAMHAARAGIALDLYVPAHTSPAKVEQARAHGARIHLVEGPREQAATVARAAARDARAFYASHALNPHFHHGVKTWAYEVVDQLGTAPDVVVLPYGSGTLVLGAALGFAELHDAGMIERVPRICAVRKAIGQDAASGSGFVVAEGLDVRNPLREAQVLRVLADVRGELVRVSDSEIIDAQQSLAAQGFFVESTSAVAWAGYRKARPTGEMVVIALTGSGLKERAS